MPSESAADASPVIAEVCTYLDVREAAAAFDFYTRVLGAQELLRIPGAKVEVARAGHDWLLRHPIASASP